MDRSRQIADYVQAEQQVDQQLLAAQRQGSDELLQNQHAQSAENALSDNTGRHSIADLHRELKLLGEMITAQGETPAAQA